MGTIFAISTYRDTKHIYHLRYKCLKNDYEDLIDKNIHIYKTLLTAKRLSSF
jgi:hypothetical protein